MSVEGTWDLTISSPFGKIGAVVELLRDEKRLVGTASGVGEDIPLLDLTLHVHIQDLHHQICTTLLARRQHCRRGS